MKNYLLTIICLCVQFIHGQEALSIKGRVLDQNNLPIEFATVYLNKTSDSSLINYTISDAQGHFKLPLASTTNATFFVISAEGYTDYVKQYNIIEKTDDIGTIVLQPKSANQLDEIVITTNVAPIKIKKDTLEFNAKSFDVRPDATVKSLLEQLPGVLVNDSGKILVNGEEVKEILINGKPFFDANGQVILNNLPANLINKVQVTDYKTKEQKLANEIATSTDKAINLTIDEDKNKGFFGNVTGGVGSDSRYEGSMLFNYFNNDTKISVLAATNNINSLGFSNNELFDNLVSGRNISLSTSSSGSVSINGFKLGSDKGIYTNNMVGFNYSDSFNKKLDLSTSYIFNQVNFNNDSKKRVENLLPDNLYITESESSEKSISKSQTANLQFEIKLNDKTTLQIDPKVDYSTVESHQNGFKSTYNQNNQLVNNQNSLINSNSNQSEVATNLSLIRKFDKKDRSLITNFLINFKRTKQDNTTKSENNFFETNTSDNRNQQLNTDKNNNTVEASIRYKEPITLKQELTISMGYAYKYHDWDRKGLNFNDLNQSYSDLATNLTFTNSMQVNQVKPSFTYRYKFEKGYLNFVAASKITDFRIKNYFINQTFNEKHVDVLPEFSLTYNFPISKNRKAIIGYSYSENINDLNKLAPVSDFANPFLTIIGNPNLKNIEKHTLYINSYTYNDVNKLGTYLNTSFNWQPVGVINKTEYDSNFKGTQTYLSGNAGNSGYFNYGVYQTKKLNENHALKYEGYFGFGLNKTYGITNDQTFTSKWFSIYPDVSLKWKYKKDFDVRLNYEFMFSNLKYDNYVIDKTQYITHKAALQTTFYWPKNIFLANDISYTYNGNISPGFKRDFYLWNVSLGYKFYNETFIAKVKVYDLLNQNTNVRRTADATQVIDEYNTILKRYVMFSLTYKISKFGGKTKNKFKFREDDDEEDE
jgi:hypothetical protein